MSEEKISMREIALNSFNKYVPVVIGIGMAAALVVPWYVSTTQRRARDEFFQKPVVTMEAKVTGERYVQPTNSPSRYFLAVDDQVRGRVSVEVMDANGVGISYGVESPNF